MWSWTCMHVYGYISSNNTEYVWQLALLWFCWHNYYAYSTLCILLCTYIRGSVLYVIMPLLFVWVLVCNNQYLRCYIYYIYIYIYIFFFFFFFDISYIIIEQQIKKRKQKKTKERKEKKKKNQQIKKSRRATTHNRCTVSPPKLGSPAAACNRIGPSLFWSIYNDSKFKIWSLDDSQSNRPMTGSHLDDN